MVGQRFGDDVQNLWKSIHMVCIQKICPKIFRDHFAVRLTIEKLLPANVHGSGASKTKGGKKGGKRKDKSSKPEKFDGNCNLCARMAM